MPQKVRPPATLYGEGLIRFFILILLFLALLYGERKLALVCLAIVGLMFLARLWGRLSPDRLFLSVTADRERLFPGESLTLRIRADNNKWLPVWIQADLALPSGFHQGEESGLRRLNAALLWRQSAELVWYLKAPRRGVYRVGPGLVRVGDLLGFFPQTFRSAVETELIVHPGLRPVRSLETPPRELVGSPCRFGPTPDPVYLLGVRDYQPGRPARFVHWKASARHSRLREKVFEPSARRKTVFILDAAGYERAGAEAEFETCLEILASLAVDLDRKGARIGFAANSMIEGDRAPFLEVGGEGRRLVGLLELLARVKMKAVQDIPNILTGGPAAVPGASILYFTYDLDESARRAGAVFERRRQSPVFLTSRLDHQEQAEADGRFRVRLMADFALESES